MTTLSSTESLEIKRRIPSSLFRRELLRHPPLRIHHCNRTLLFSHIYAHILHSSIPPPKFGWHQAAITHPGAKHNSLAAHRHHPAILPAAETLVKNGLASPYNTRRKSFTKSFLEEACGLARFFALRHYYRLLESSIHDAFSFQVEFSN